MSGNVTVDMIAAGTGVKPIECLILLRRLSGAADLFDIFEKPW